MAAAVQNDCGMEEKSARFIRTLEKYSFLLSIKNICGNEPRNFCMKTFRTFPELQWQIYFFKQTRNFEVHLKAGARAIAVLTKCYIAGNVVEYTARRNSIRSDNDHSFVFEIANLGIVKPRNGKLLLYCSFSILDLTVTMAYEDLQQKMLRRLNILDTPTCDRPTLVKACGFYKSNVGKMRCVLIVNCCSPLLENTFDVTTGIPRVGLQVSVLLDIIIFRYTKILRNMDLVNISTLYNTAVRYSLIALKKYCSRVLGTIMSMENVYGIQMLAEAHSDSDLKKQAKEFLEKGYAK